MEGTDSSVLFVAFRLEVTCGLEDEQATADQMPILGMLSLMYRLTIISSLDAKPSQRRLGGWEF